MQVIPMIPEIEHLLQVIHQGKVLGLIFLEVEVEMKQQ
jgi:hypothetical protein